MAYEPLHHKYRPQMFQHLVGQTAIATTLTNALQQQRIAPAYLFTGPRGTGKTSSARILAKSLNCLASDRPTATPCGQCEACQSIARGTALDVIEIDAASNTGVDNIRELIEKSQFAPVQCRYKVYVIDECHMLSTAAFNALLKTLEEPPDRVIFVLATTDPQRVLPTIISRCQRFDFRRIPLDAMVSHLQQIAQQEQIEITEAAVTLVAQIAQGGLRDAESLLDQLSLLPPPITPEAVWDLVGAVPERDLLALTEAIAANQPEQLIDVARRLMNRGREPLIVLQNLASFYRDLLIAKTAPQRGDLVAITADTWQEMCQFVQSIDLNAILQGQQHLRSSEVQLKNTTQPRLWLEVTLMGLLPTTLAAAAPVATPIASPPPPAPATPTAALPTPTIPTGAAPTPPAIVPVPAASPTQAATPSVAQPPMTAPAPVSPAAPPTGHPLAPTASTASESVASAPLAPPPEPASSPDLNQLWQRVVNRLSSRSTRILLEQQVRLLDVQGGRVRISSPPGLKQTVETRIPQVEEVFTQVLGRSVSIQLETRAKTDSTAPPTAGPSLSPAQTASPGPPTPTSPAPTPQPPAPPQTPIASPPPAPVTPPPSSVSPTSTHPTTAPQPTSAPQTAPDPVAPQAAAPPTPDQSQTPAPQPPTPPPVVPQPSAPHTSVTPASPHPPTPHIPTPQAPTPQATPSPLPPSTQVNQPVTAVTAGLAPKTGEAISTTRSAMWADDEVARAAKSLADFFNGQVVQEDGDPNEIDLEIWNQIPLEEDEAF